MAKFKAKPNKVVGAEPFVPKRSTKPLTGMLKFINIK